MTLEEAKNAVVALWQITQLANQPAKTHISCQETKEKLLAFLEEKRVDPGPEEK